MLKNVELADNNVRRASHSNVVGKEKPVVTIVRTERKDRIHCGKNKLPNDRMCPTTYKEWTFHGSVSAVQL